jgi:hypothetical protein
MSWTDWEGLISTMEKAARYGTPIGRCRYNPPCRSPIREDQ